MAKKEITPVQRLKSKVENNGLDHAVAEYSEWGEILDPEFHRLREYYIEIKNELTEYIESMNEEQSDDDE